MECLWRLFGHWKPDGHSCQQDTAVFYLYFNSNHGFPDHYLHGIGFLEKCKEVYLGGKKKPLVLPVNLKGRLKNQIMTFRHPSYP